MLGISGYAMRRRTPIRFLRRRDRNSVIAARCDRINKSSSLNRSSAHRYIHRKAEIVFDIIICCAPGAVDEHGMLALRIPFNRTFCSVFLVTRFHESAFFIFMNILSSFLCQGEFRCFKFYRIPIPPPHTTFSQKKLYAFPSQSMINIYIYTVCVYYSL